MYDAPELDVPIFVHKDDRSQNKIANRRRVLESGENR
jgi:hypothetical protein